MWKKSGIPFLLVFFHFLHTCLSTYDCMQHCACEMTDENLVADCSGANFTDVPRPEPNYQVNILYLQFNRITRLRAGDFRLYTDLEELYVQGNRINTIEKNAFDGLQRLRKLDLSKNMIHVLPVDEMSRASANLVWLSIAMNSLRDLPILSYFAKLEYLDLSNNRLIRELIPGSLPSSLTKLDLHYTGIKNFRRSAFHNLTNLKTLFLHDNMASAAVKFETGVFDDLTYLEFLDLSRCFCKKMPRKSFTKLKRLRTLMLNNCWLTTPPILARQFSVGRDAQSGRHRTKGLEKEWGSTEWLNSTTKRPYSEVANATWYNPHLTLLDLSNNRRMTINPDQTRFPPSLTELRLSRTNFPLINNDVFRETTLIQKLDLCHSKVRVIEKDAFIHLRNASEICLSGNPLEVAPRLPALLTTLNLSDTKVTNLTSTMLAELSSVINADLKRSKMQFVEDSALSNMTSLQTMDLSENNLHIIGKYSLSVGFHSSHGSPDIPQITGTKSNLLQLDLSSNLLAHIETGAFVTHGQLEVLDLQTNFLEVIDEGFFGGLVNLKNLKLNQNYIADITPGAFQDLTNLEILHLEQNKIEILHSGTFRGLKALKELNLQDNKLIVVHEVVLPSLEYLDLSFNKLTIFPQIEGGELREIKLGGNLIKGFESDALQNTVNLQILDLSQCRINRIEYSAFENTPHLRELDLTGNYITKFINEILPALESLLIAENEIRSITNNIENVCPMLQTLDIGYNNISQLHPDVFNGAKSLNEVDLSGNNFQCDCELLPLVQWIEAHFDIVVDPDFYLCDGPTDAYAMPIFDAVYDLECDEPSPGLSARDKIYIGVAMIIGVLSLILIVLLTLVIHRKSKDKRRKTERNGKLGNEDGTEVLEHRCCEPFKKWYFGLSDYTRDKRHQNRVPSEEGRDLMSTSRVTSSTSETEGPTPV